MLYFTLPARQRDDRDMDDVSVASDDVIIDDEPCDVIVDRKSSVVDQLREDFEKFCKMRTEKDKFKVLMSAFDRTLK